MKRRLLALGAALLLLWCGAASAWVADGWFETVEDLPPEVRGALPEDLRYLDGMRGGETLFLLMEAGDGARRVLVFRRPVETWRLDCQSPPLYGEPTIGCSGDSLHLFYEEGGRTLSPSFHRLVDGRWMLSNMMGNEIFGYHPFFGLWTDSGENETYKRSWAPDVTLFTLDTLHIADLPASPEEALAMRTRAGDIAVVTSQVPTDRLHLRNGPAKDAASLGRYYSGTPVRVLSTEGGWCKVSVTGITGYMMRAYLTFGDAMLEVPQYFLQKLLREEYRQPGDGQQVRLYSRPDKASAVVGTLDSRNAGWPGMTILAVVGEDWYHVVCDDGSMGYVQQKYFWDGNG